MQMFHVPSSIGGLSRPEEAVLRRFDRASLDLLNARALLKRVDTKCVAPREKLSPLLERLSREFAVVYSGDVPWGTYETVYFDTPELAMFHAHRRGRAPRHKVRIRHYAERNVCYLETKTKDRYKVTTKHRFEHTPRDFTLSAEDLSRVAGALGIDEPLRPVVALQFSRITLVGLVCEERLTIDVGLACGAEDEVEAFQSTVVVELKQPRFNARSPGMAALRALSIRPGSLSKYCVSLCALHAADRDAVFRPALRSLQGSVHA